MLTLTPLATSNTLDQDLKIRLEDIYSTNMESQEKKENVLDLDFTWRRNMVKQMKSECYTDTHMARTGNRSRSLQVGTAGTGFFVE